jgi:hypothetical protein
VLYAIPFEACIEMSHSFSINNRIIMTIKEMGINYKYSLNEILGIYIHEDIHRSNNINHVCMIY